MAGLSETPRAVLADWKLSQVDTYLEFLFWETSGFAHETFD